MNDIATTHASTFRLLVEARAAVESQSTLIVELYARIDALEAEVQAMHRTIAHIATGGRVIAL